LKRHHLARNPQNPALQRDSVAGGEHQFTTSGVESWLTGISSAL
jgi:hypothetical protein